VKSQTDPRYYFSRKVRLENALEIFSHSGVEDVPTDHGPQGRNDYESLKTVGGGLFKTVFFHAITIVIVEYVYLPPPPPLLLCHDVLKVLIQPLPSLVQSYSFTFLHRVLLT
jgi:hypothetical protein